MDVFDDNPFVVQRQIVVGEVPEALDAEADEVPGEFDRRLLRDTEDRHRRADPFAEVVEGGDVLDGHPGDLPPDEVGF